MYMNGESGLIFQGFSDPDDLSIDLQCEFTHITATISSPFGAKVSLSQLFKINSSSSAKASTTEQITKQTTEKTTEQATDSQLDQVSLPFFYRFPIPPSGSITKFKATIGNNRTVVGKFSSAGKAKAEYKEVIENKPDTVAALVTTYSNDIFQVDFGNIPSNTTVKVELEYFSMLEYDTQYNGYRFFIPTDIFPRYGLEPENKNTITGSQSINTVPQSGTFISVKLSSSKTQILECVSHKKLAKVTDNLVTYSGDEEPRLEHDFVVIVKDRESSELCAHLSNRDSKTPIFNNLLTINFRPNFDFKTVRPKELIFLIDRSASMTCSIQTLKEALQFYLSSLPSRGDATDCPIYFNFVSFGSTYEFLWPHSKLLDNKSFKDAREFIKTIEADFGGTEILLPLEEIHKRLTTPNYLEDLSLFQRESMDHEIIVLTDGEVYNVSEIYKTVNEMASSFNSTGNGLLRVHSFGVGESVSHGLLDALSQAGCGIKQNVLTGERMEIKISKLLQMILSSPVIGVNVYWSLKNGEKKTDTEDEFEILEGYGAPLHYKFGMPNKVEISYKGHLETPGIGLLPIFSGNDSKMYIFVEDGSVVAPSVKIELLLCDGTTTTYEAPVAQDEADEKDEFLFFGGARSLLNAFENGQDLDVYDTTDVSKKAEIDKFCELVGQTFEMTSKWTSLLGVEKNINRFTNRFLSAQNFGMNRAIVMNRGENLDLNAQSLSLASMQFRKSSKRRVLFDTDRFTSGITNFINSTSEAISGLLSKRSVSETNQQVQEQPDTVTAIEISSTETPIEDTVTAIEISSTEIPIEKAYRELSIISLACNFDGSFDVTPEIYTLLSPAHSQHPLETLQAAQASDAKGYIALAVSVYLVVLDNATKGIEKDFGNSLKPLVEKINKFIDHAYGQNKEKLEEDRTTLENLFKETS